MSHYDLKIKAVLCKYSMYEDKLKTNEIINDNAL